MPAGPHDGAVSENNAAIIFGRARARPTTIRTDKNMEHSLPLISTLVIAFSLALVFGFIAERFLRSPALVGYLLAGIAAGKYTPGVFADAALASQLSEIGVMLLMFGVGLHFSMKDLWSVKGIAVPGAILQMTIATALGACFAHAFFDRVWGEAIVLGISLSCASTVVLLKALEVRGKLTSTNGRIAVGWLVVEDMATVVILVILPPLANLMIPGKPGTLARLAEADLSMMILQTLAGAAVFVAVMLVVGRRVLPWAMGQVARTGSRELFTLFVLAVAVGVAYGASEIFHVSFALGAFFAGMVMRESRFAHRAATESLPLQDAFAVLFFVGVGMLFDWHILIESPLEVLAVLAVIVFGKSIVAFALVFALRYPLHSCLVIAVSLAQIGEFSFILIGQAAQVGLADEHMINLVIAGSIISIALNPFLFGIEPRARVFLTSRFAWARRSDMRQAPFEALPADTEVEKLSGQAVIAGSGPLLERLARTLEEGDIPVVAVSADEAVARDLAARKVSVVQGDPSKEETWIHAHLHNAKLLVLLDSGSESLRIAEAARRVSPDLPITVAATSRGIWPEVKMENVTYLSTVEASARLISAQTAAAMRAGTKLGNPVCMGEAEAAEADAEAAPAAAEAKAEVRERVAGLAERLRGMMRRRPAAAPAAEAPAKPKAEERSAAAPESAAAEAHDKSEAGTESAAESAAERAEARVGQAAEAAAGAAREVRGRAASIAGRLREANPLKGFLSSRTEPAEDRRGEPVEAVTAPAAAKTESAPEAQSEPQSEVKTDVKPEATAESRPEMKPEAKADEPADARSEGAAEAPAETAAGDRSGGKGAAG